MPVEKKKKKEFELNFALKNNYIGLPSFFLSFTKSIQCCLDALFSESISGVVVAAANPPFSLPVHTSHHTVGIFWGLRFQFSVEFLISAIKQTLLKNSRVCWQKVFNIRNVTFKLKISP